MNLLEEMRLLAEYRRGQEEEEMVRSMNEYQFREYLLNKMFEQNNQLKELAPKILQVINDRDEVIRIQTQMIDQYKLMVKEIEWQRDYYKENYEALKIQMEGR